MKKLIILFLALVILIGTLFILKGSSKQTLVSPSPTPASSENSLSFCKPSDLGATLTSEGAAGNIFLTLTIKNISEKNCQIIGNNYITPLFNAKNITTKNQGQVGPQTLSLSPNQIAYSQVHYPNGPQCSRQVSEITISYSYNISASDSITFKNQNEETKQSIGVCRSASELTEVDVWSLSERPVNQ